MTSLFLDEMRNAYIHRILDMCRETACVPHGYGIGRTSLYRYLKEDTEQKPKITKVGGASVGARI